MTFLLALAAAATLSAPNVVAKPALRYAPLSHAHHYRLTVAPAPSPASAPSAAASAPAAPAVTLTADEQALLDAVNAARAAQGLRALTVDASLERAARAHGADLAENGAFTHDFVGGGSSTPFGSWIGRYYTGNCAGENLAEGSPSLGAAQAVQMWLASPGHRANMLSASFTTIGVAVVQANGTTIAVNDFGGC